MNWRIISLILLMAVACSEDENATRPYPRMKTYEVTDITSEGAVFSGEILSISGKLIDYGFVWSIYESPMLDYGEVLSLGTKSTKGKFSHSIQRSLAEGQTYYMRAYAKSEKYVVYGDLVEFVSLGSKAPQIQSFSPLSATWRDTITINGENLSGLVKFDSTNALVISNDGSKIKVIVPDGFFNPQGKVSISFAGNKSTANELFSLKQPELKTLSPGTGTYNTLVNIEGLYFHPYHNIIEFGGVRAKISSYGTRHIACWIPKDAPGGNISLKIICGRQYKIFNDVFLNQAPMISTIVPLGGTYGDIVTIQGNFFGSSAVNNVVKFDNVNAEIISASATEIKVKVPEALANWHLKISVETNGQTAASQQYFDLTPATIISVAPVNVSIGSEVTVTGSGFNALGYNEVYIGDDAAEIVSYAADKLVVNVPPYLSSHDLNVTVLVSGQSVAAQQTLRSVWSMLGYIHPDEYDVSTIVVGNRVLFYAGYLFYEYNMTEKTWTKKNITPFGSTGKVVSFSLGDSAYVMNSAGPAFAAYNPASDTWVPKNGVPFFIDYNTSFACELDNVGYLINTGDMWKYDATVDSWDQVLSLPNVQLNNEFVSGDKLYGFDMNSSPNTLWRYDATNDSWTNLGAVPFVNNTYGAGFVFEINGNGYYGMGDSNEFWKYTVSNNTWTKLSDYGSYQTIKAPAFSLNGKGYVVGGYYQNEIWEFDLN